MSFARKSLSPSRRTIASRPTCCSRATSKAKLPAMLCLHQTVKIGKGEPAGVGGAREPAYALELAERGYVTLAPDYPNFGDYKIDLYAKGYASATMKGIWNHMRAVDLLQSLARSGRRAHWLHRPFARRPQLAVCRRPSIRASKSW